MPLARALPLLRRAAAEDKRRQRLGTTPAQCTARRQRASGERSGLARDAWTAERQRGQGRHRGQKQYAAAPCSATRPSSRAACAVTRNAATRRPAAPARTPPAARARTQPRQPSPAPSHAAVRQLPPAACAAPRPPRPARGPALYPARAKRSSRPRRRHPQAAQPA